LDPDTGKHQVLREKYTGLVSGGRDGTIRIWNLDMGEHEVLREKHTGLVSGGKDRKILKRHHFR
jgi:WD40 repeat protein